MKVKTEQLKQQRLAEASTKGQEILSQRQEEKANKAKLQEQKEKEAKEFPLDVQVYFSWFFICPVKQAIAPITNAHR